MTDLQQNRGKFHQQQSAGVTSPTELQEVCAKQARDPSNNYPTSSRKENDFCRASTKLFSLSVLLFCERPLNSLSGNSGNEKRFLTSLTGFRSTWESNCPTTALHDNGFLSCVSQTLSYIKKRLSICLFIQIRRSAVSLVSKKLSVPSISPSMMRPSDHSDSGNLQQDRFKVPSLVFLWLNSFKQTNASICHTSSNRACVAESYFEGNSRDIEDYLFIDLHAEKLS